MSMVIVLGDDILLQCNVQKIILAALIVAPKYK